MNTIFSNSDIFGLESTYSRDVGQITKCWNVWEVCISYIRSQLFLKAGGHMWFRTMYTCFWTAAAGGDLVQFFTIIAGKRFICVSPSGWTVIVTISAINTSGEGRRPMLLRVWSFDCENWLQAESVLNVSGMLGMTFHLTPSVCPYCH